LQFHPVEPGLTHRCRGGLMGLLRQLLTLPVAGPLRGTGWIAEKIHEAAEKEHNSPAAIRKALAALEAQLLAGEISEDEYDQAETALLQRLQAAS
ncbi:MAG: gas vesicle protein GvpG, partial [Pseudomonadota bacterium]